MQKLTQILCHGSALRCLAHARAQLVRRETAAAEGGCQWRGEFGVHRVGVDGSVLAAAVFHKQLHGYFAPGEAPGALEGARNALAVDPVEARKAMVAFFNLRLLKIRL